MTRTSFAAGIIALATVVHAAEYHVAVIGNDNNPGSRAAPVRTIQRAAGLARPGDTITVHQGVYRERVAPPRGGTSNSRRIVYQAAPGEKVEIKGSEAVNTWEKVQEDVWKVVLPNSYFGAFNPYNDLIHGDWFSPKGRQHHTGAVYLDGDWLTEAAALDDVLKAAGATPLWFAKVDDASTTIWAQFKDINPNEHLVEINARPTVFYPEKCGVNYITVRGFSMSQAATPWAPPTAEQVGLIGPHWSKGWIIESNTVSYSICSGISLGKYGDQWDNTSANTAEGYVATIRRALTNGWNKATVGSHIVRYNEISHCEQAGIVGSLGAVFSTIASNNIHDIHVRRLFSGAEMAGIKFHAAIDVQIVGNHIHRACLGLWLDWMAQGTRISRNLLHDNDHDLFAEVDHGPFLIDNNIFLSANSVVSRSQGGAYAHNLFAGRFDMNSYDARQTPFMKAHSTALAGFHDNPRGDDRFYNNIFASRPNLSQYEKPWAPVWMDGNVFLKGAKPCPEEKDAIAEPNFDPAIQLTERPDGCFLDCTFDSKWIQERSRETVTTKLLGKAIIPDVPYENPNGGAIRISTDYACRQRHSTNPAPGPFEDIGGPRHLKVW